MKVIVTDTKIILKMPAETGTKVIRVAEQGPAGNNNVYIGPDQPTSTTPFLWLQTGLPNGGYSLWIYTP